MLHFLCNKGAPIKEHRFEKHAVGRVTEDELEELGSLAMEDLDCVGTGTTDALDGGIAVAGQLDAEYNLKSWFRDGEEEVPKCFRLVGSCNACILEIVDTVNKPVLQ